MPAHMLPRTLRHKLIYCISAIAILGGCLWLFFFSSRGPINAANFAKLKLDMTQADVEAVLGGPAPKSQPYPRMLQASPGSKVLVPLLFDDPLPGFTTYFDERELGKQQWGDWSAAIQEICRPETEYREVAVVHIWDGPNTRIAASFDKEGRLSGARFQQRITLCAKLQRWLPWLQ